jgi:hypothetical protein
VGQALHFLPGKNGARPTVSVSTQASRLLARPKAPRSVASAPERGCHPGALISRASREARGALSG